MGRGSIASLVVPIHPNVYEEPHGGKFRGKSLDTISTLVQLGEL